MRDLFTAQLVWSTIRLSTPLILAGLGGLIYFLIGPFKFWLGSYAAKQHRRLALSE